MAQLPDIENLAQPLKDFSFQYIIGYPNGRRFRKTSQVIGSLSDARWLRDQILHGLPLGTKIHVEGMVDEVGKLMPRENQPELLSTAWPKPHPDDHLNKLQKLGRVTHPGPGAPRGFTFLTDVGDELEPEPGSEAALAAEKGEKLVGIGHKGQEPESGPRKLWTPAPSKAGQELIDEAKRVADGQQATFAEELDPMNLPTTAEATERRKKTAAERRKE